MFAVKIPFNEKYYCPFCKKITRKVTSASENKLRRYCKKYDKMLNFGNTTTHGERK